MDLLKQFPKLHLRKCYIWLIDQKLHYTSSYYAQVADDNTNNNVKCIKTCPNT